MIHVTRRIQIGQDGNGQWAWMIFHATGRLYRSGWGLPDEQMAWEIAEAEYASGVRRGQLMKLPLNRWSAQ